MSRIEPDAAVLAAHELLVARGILEPLAADDDDVRRWLAWELASLIEGHFHRRVDANAFSRSEWQEWEQRVTESVGLHDPRRDDLRRAYWLLQDGERAGTFAIDALQLGRPELAISSLYVRPDLRG